MAQWRGAQVAAGVEGDMINVASTIPYANSQVAPDESLPGGWHPTVAYMIAFVIGEIFVYHFLSKHLNIS
jgi:hypothetical protein